MSQYDAVVVGSGPNGLAAAIALAQRGLSVVVFEARPTIGGGTRSAELTLPGFVHDVCSAIHPMAIGSPFFQTLPLEQHGLEWIHPLAPVAHPLDDGPAVLVERTIDDTIVAFGDDALRYARRMRPLESAAENLFSDLLGPLQLPGHPVAAVRFGLSAIQSASGLAGRWFRTSAARAMFAGVAAHSLLPLSRPPSAAVGLMLLIAAHAYGWPLPKGGSQAISNALAGHLRSLGGEIRVNQPITNIDELPKTRAVLLDVTPRQVLSLAGHRFPAGYQRALERYRYGPGVFKLDWALERPIPWNDPRCARAGTVHVGGTLEEIAAAEAAAFGGRSPDQPFVLVAQQSLFDASRAPAGQHTGWAYCHVPHRGEADMMERIERQVERFAPGFRDTILARHAFSPAALEQYNPNCVGGDITGGVQDFGQLLTRPVARLRPYRTAAAGVYICSSSTPPGGGVHGMCGYFAAQTALRDCFR